MTEEHISEITDVANRLAGKIDAYLSLGIGGSYLGIEATIRALQPTYFNQMSPGQRDGVPQIYFLGQNLDPDFFEETMQVIKGKRLGVNVISKSGTTAETAIAFRIIRAYLEDTAGEHAAADLIVATTDANKGALRKLAEQKGYQTFVVPDDIGGRFSVLSDVGLFGLGVAGIDLSEFIAGFRDMKRRTDTDDFWSNPAMLHAAVRYLAWKKDKKIEVVATNSSHLYQLTRWMEQLFPESEGHHGHGMWVSPSMYSEKLHANGQMVQDGERNILETFLKLSQHDHAVSIPGDDENLDGLNYLSDANKTMNDVNQLVIDGPAFAHFQGGVPNMTLTIPRRSAYCIGQLYFLMERSVAISGYLMGHNPFVQPGVEAYKKAMFALAGKPGSESFKKEMKAATDELTRLVV
jgi:glucose-6-phosphate isomerase